MGTPGMTVAAVVLSIGIASSGFAQETGSSPAPLLPSRTVPVQAVPAPNLSNTDQESELAELQQWIHAFTDWQEWSAQWRNRREPGLFTGSRERPEKPAPPAWLAERCATVVDDQDPIAPGCDLVEAWRLDLASVGIQQSRTAVVNKQEEQAKSIWWEHVHMDVLWPAMQWQQSVYGVVGMHTAMKVGKRLQLFTAPGALLLNLPTVNGDRAWKVAVNYGMGWRLTDFTFPGGAPAELHLNIAKAWLLSDSLAVIGGRSLDLVGFSVTFKKR